MNKKTLRQELLNNRINDSEKDNRIFKKLIELPEFIKSEIVLSYVSKKSEQIKYTEIDTINFIKYCIGIKRIFVPKTYKNEIIFYEIRSFNDLESGAFGILEPKQNLKPIDKNLFKNSICIIPSLACNKENHRIGYGKGYYDMFLKDYNGFSVILCYKENILDFEAGELDVSADMVITD